MSKRNPPPGQRSFDGKEQPPSRNQRIRKMLDEWGSEIDWEQTVDKACQVGIYRLEDYPEMIRKGILSEIQAVARSMTDKSGVPRIIPVDGDPGQAVLLDVARTEDRYRNVIRRGLITFGNHRKWFSSVRDMEERKEETLPVVEFKEGWAEIFKRYQIAEAEKQEQQKPGGDDRPDDEDEAAD